MVLSNGAWKYVPFQPEPEVLGRMDVAARAMMGQTQRATCANSLLRVIHYRSHLAPEEGEVTVEVTPWGLHRLNSLAASLEERARAQVGPMEEEEEEEEE